MLFKLANYKVNHKQEEITEGTKFQSTYYESSSRQVEDDNQPSKPEKKEGERGVCHDTC